jgi:hypothetical protein
MRNWDSSEGEWICASINMVISKNKTCNIGSQNIPDMTNPRNKWIKLSWKIEEYRGGTKCFVVWK